MTTLAKLECDLETCHTATSQVAAELVSIGLSCSTLDEGLHAAIILKEYDKFDQASFVFQRLLADWPNEERLVYEHIQFLHRIGQEVEANETLIKVVQQGLHGDNILRECILRAFIRPVRLDATHSRILHSLLLAVSRSTSSYSLATVNYFASINAISTLETLQRSEFQTLLTTRDQCLQAIRSKMPFCLLRLGDGEGAFLHPADYPQVQEALFVKHQQFFTDRWYNDAALANSAAFTDVVAELWTRVSEADIIGVPQPDWIQHEIKMCNLPSLINCLQIARLVDNFGFGNSGRLSTTTVAVDLEYHGFINDILREAGPISLITSHPMLGQRLTAAGRVQVRQTILIPPAHSDLGQTGYELHSSHFRDVFDSVNDAIDNSIKPGEVVLVSAGFLGKLYSLRIKRCGGIALDIGSLTDLWMGYMTRPVFRELEKMQLDAHSA